LLTVPEIEEVKKGEKVKEGKEEKERTETEVLVLLRVRQRGRVGGERGQGRKGWRQSVNVIKLFLLFNTDIRTKMLECLSPSKDFTT
jgi:hypothetical protein